MKHKINLLKSELIEIPNRKIWNDQARFTLAHVVTFNRKRVGEVQRLTVETHNSKCTSPVQEEVKACLSQMEVRLAESLSRIETRGKVGRKVAM